MFNLSKQVNIKKEFCFECRRTCLHTVEYSKNKLKAKRLCLLCKHISHWVISVYPYPSDKNSDKQIDYIVKDIKDSLENI